MSAQDLVEWISRRHLSGNWVVRNEEIERSFIFDSGYCIAVSSVVKGERLGALLTYKGIVLPKTLGEAFEVQSETGVSLGKILLMINAVTEDELGQTLQEKITESLLDTLFWERGTFVFVQSYDRRPVSEYDTSVSLLACLEKASNRRRVWGQIRKNFSPGMIATSVEDIESETIEDLWTKKLLRKLSSPLEIKKLYEEIPMFRYEVMRRLLDAKERELLRLTGEGTVGLETGLLLKQADSLHSGGDYVGAHELAQKAVSQAPDSTDARALLLQLKRKLFRESLVLLLKDGKRLRACKSVSEFSARKQVLVPMLDGFRDTLTIVRQSGMSAVDTTLLLREMYDDGMVELV